MVKQYGIFSNSLNCFLLSSDDLWLTMHTAKLASSKLSLSVCDISKFENISNDPENWTLTDLSEIAHNLKLYVVSKGLESFSSTDDRIFESKELLQHIYNIVKSSWMTDAYLNFTDQNFYKLFIEETNFSSFDDLIGSETGFLKSIDSILYNSTSVEDINQNINDFFNSTYSLRPQILKFYKKTFYNLLKNEQ